MNGVNIPESLKYTKSHEWVLIEGDIATVGITDYAQQHMTDIVYVELPKVGKIVKKGESVAVVESVKASADVYSPLSGEIIAINEKLNSTPEKLNEDPYESWIFKLKISKPDEIKELLSASDYLNLIRKES